MGSPGSNALATATRVGLSQPISTGGPTESDIAKTRELEKVGCLHSSVIFVHYIQLCSCLEGHCPYIVVARGKERNGCCVM